MILIETSKYSKSIKKFKNPNLKDIPIFGTANQLKQWSCLEFAILVVQLQFDVYQILTNFFEIG